MSDDLVVRGGEVVDGTGAPPRRADVRIAGGRVAEVGPSLRGDRELDAGGALVVPGFIDIHTHYDPQVLWDPDLTPSSHHGVTSVVAGSCGYSLAPCLPGDREVLVAILEHVEDMSAATLRAGIPWSFETYGEYLGAVAAAGTAVNFGGFVGHTAVRVRVMGDDAHERAATPSEVEAMRTEVAAALRAGALGFSTDRAGFHVGVRGRPVPSMNADADEVEALMAVTRDLGHGISHVAPGRGYPWVYEVQRRLGRPVTWSGLLTFPPGSPHAGWRDKLDTHRVGWAAGVDARPQVTPRPVQGLVTLADPNPLYQVPSWGELSTLDGPAARALRYRDAAWRDRARSELLGRQWVDLRWELVTVAETTTQPELAGRSLAEVAAARQISPVDAMLDVALADDLATRFRVAWANDDVEGVAELLRTDGCVLGLSDAGAHVGQICDAVMPTDFLAGWVRDRQLLPVEAGVRKLTGELADLLELPDRGRLVPGAWADVVVLDWDELDPGPIRRVTDFPADGDRLTADAPRGYRHILVNGRPIRRDGVQLELAPHERPGRILDNRPA